jgi:hypothetical protein
MNAEDIVKSFAELFSNLLRRMTHVRYTGGVDDEPLMHSPIAATAQDALLACCTILGTVRYTSALLETSGALNAADPHMWLCMEVSQADPFCTLHGLCRASSIILDLPHAHVFEACLHHCPL